MHLYYQYPYTTVIVSIVLLNLIIKAVANMEQSPLAFLLLGMISLIGRAFSPFAGAVDKELSDNYYFSRNKQAIRYSPMGNWFELGNAKMDADPNSFKVLARNFAKDKDHLYYKSSIIDQEADKESLRVVDDYYCLDKNHVYVPAEYVYSPFDEPDENPDPKAKLHRIEKANPTTYEPINDDWAKDDRHFFYRHKFVDVEYESFEIINKNFCKDSKCVWMQNDNDLIASDIDPSATRKLNKSLIADQLHIYDFKMYVENELANKLFAYAYEDLSSFEDLDEDYFIFDDKVVYQNNYLEGAHAATFEVMDPTYYARDKNHIYYAGLPMEHVDIESFELFEYACYAKDKNHIYAEGKILKEADLATFGPLNDDSLIYKDKNHQYRGNEILAKEEEVKG
ncbi:DKNYY domain-containing protein [Flammeovirgaceae bacterium SG7u.111]|nr:DKNYY domain-containing protein [Flammeovirgaceae bacterium SG7u.132]WPO34056.1 DKNYY domain-containing protein [Flammeovirgaceae bacterium SG7u.111]